MEFSVKVVGVEHKSQSIIIDRRNLSLIEDIDNFSRDSRQLMSDSFYKYEGREVFAKYIGKSRIDGEPMFKIDTLQVERDDKISEILK